MDKIDKIIEYCKSMKFSYGDHDGMSKAENVVFVLKQYKRNELDYDMLLEQLEGIGCPYNDIELCNTVADKESQIKQCQECWKASLES